MLVKMIEGVTRTLGKSQGYIGLPVRDGREIDNTTGKEVSTMTTAWEPTIEELGKIVKGAPIYVTIFGTIHPPIRLEVGEPLDDVNFPKGGTNEEKPYEGS